MCLGREARPEAAIPGTFQLDHFNTYLLSTEHMCHSGMFIFSQGEGIISCAQSSQVAEASRLRALGHQPLRKLLGLQVGKGAAGGVADARLSLVQDLVPRSHGVRRGTLQPLANQSSTLRRGRLMCCVNSVGSFLNGKLD